MLCHVYLGWKCMCVIQLQQNPSHINHHSIRLFHKCVNISFVNHSLNECQSTCVVPMLLDRVFSLENYDGKETATVSTTKELWFG